MNQLVGVGQLQLIGRAWSSPVNQHNGLEGGSAHAVTTGRLTSVWAGIRTEMFVYMRNNNTMTQTKGET